MAWIKNYLSAQFFLLNDLNTMHASAHLYVTYIPVYLCIRVL
uniref:Uncharacterized protein n=1 Tax=Rhizophora mucronata TaxID=61149 RepID=A0A2P2N7R4_RHIMU